MKKIIALVIVISICIGLLSIHICYTKRDGIAVFRKQSLNVAYTFVNLNEDDPTTREELNVFLYMVMKYKQYKHLK